MDIPRPLPVLAIAVALVVPTVLANHPQTRHDEAPPVVFDHDGDNEWWVEVLVNVGAIQVHARVEGTNTWRLLRHIGTTDDGWHKWMTDTRNQAPFQVPPGQRVQFSAYLTDNNGETFTQLSCWFTHPVGVEQCDPGTTDPLRATFSGLSGNEWWEQVSVSSNRQIHGVDVVIFTVDGAFGHRLTFRSWGAWAGSYHAPAGTLVAFNAFWGTESVTSSCYRWPSAEVRPCPGLGDQVFDHKGGNEWWVEVDTGPIVPTRVQARDDGGPWMDLPKRSWGNWAASFHIEPGHQVQFRAEREGAWYESCLFSHPAGVAPGNMRMCWAPRTS